MSTKTIAVVGSTGNQGGSVANTFLSTPGWKVRGLTRDPTKASSASWKEKGVDLVAANLDDVASLKAAFSGADVVFGVTDFWQHFQDPKAQAEAKSRSITVNEIAYECEVQHGKNIVDAAAATVSSLSHFILSTMNDAKYWSKGKITFNLHFDAKWAAVEYCKATYPDLWAKTSLLQLGVFASNYKSGMGFPKKQDDGTYKLSMPMSGSKNVPFVDTNADTGRFVRALLELPPNTNLMGAGSSVSWEEYGAIWGRINNVQVSYGTFPGAALEQMMGSMGRELADMFLYMEEFGYDGGDPSIVYPWDLKEKFGVDVEYTPIEEYLASQDWSRYL